jgi:hypothetical protein
MRSIIILFLTIVGYNSCYAQEKNAFIKINSLFFNTNDKTTFRINASGDYLEIYNVDVSFQREVNDIGGIPSPSMPYPNTLSFTTIGAVFSSVSLHNHMLLGTVNPALGTILVTFRSPTSTVLNVLQTLEVGKMSIIGIEDIGGGEILSQRIYCTFRTFSIESGQRDDKGSIVGRIKSGWDFNRNVAL